jgi:EAL domain-containing protein (putative c-di-GMP-specific phosphodiesterase class I)
LGSTNGTYLNGQRITGPVEVAQDDFIQFGSVAFRVLRQSSHDDGGTVCEDVVDRAMALVQFDRLMSEEAVIPHYQPIVELPGERPFGFEVLVRSRIAGMDTPMVMFSAAAQLSLEAQLSQMIRCKAVEETRTFHPPPHLFVNTHPVELQEAGLIESMRALRELSRHQRITLEIHEKAVTDSAGIMELRAALRDMDIGLAFDDFGAGETRLSQLSKIQPDYLKFDISLVHNLHQASSEHQQMIRALVRMAENMGVIPLAEGVECREERNVCVELGFKTGQGFYFGRPIPLRAERGSDG